MPNGLASKVTIIGLAFVGAATEGRPYKGAIKEFRLLGQSPAKQNSCNNGHRARLDAHQLRRPIAEHVPWAESQIGLFRKGDAYTGKS